MEKPPFFTIIIVCLNPGEKLEKTVNSIKIQTVGDYEVVIKDGLSADGALDTWERQNCDTRFYLIRKKDSGIYDAMNQAAAVARGRYIYFLNAGDVFWDETVLEQVKEAITKMGRQPGIVYGNIYEVLTGQHVTSNPALNRFGCYRNVPCHQTCFYERELLLSHPFVLQYRVRADYEQFLWCVLKRKTWYTHLSLTVARYEGGGFSESKENRRRSAAEHKEIVKQYMGRGEILCYRIILWLTLAPLRTRLAGNQATAAWYQKLKGLLYHHKQ